MPYFSSISFSAFVMALFLFIFSCFNFSTVSELVLTSNLICSICFLYSSIAFASSSFSFKHASLCAFLLAILLTFPSISASILASISSNELLLSSNELTDIFRFVISKFKSSMYFWFSLFFSAKLWISWFKLFVSSSNSNEFCFISAFSASLLSIVFSISTVSFFNFSSFASKLDIASSSVSILCFSVAYSISISWLVCSILATSSSKSSIDVSYSSFSLVIFSISLFNFSISFSSSFIWFVLPIMLVVFCVVEPPDIAPLGLIISPFSVTILKL